MKVAVMGTGIMGGGIARNLVRAGHDVVVWNRTRQKAEAIEGATVAASAGEAARGAEVLVTMLADGPAVADAVDLDGFDGVWAQMSTVGVEWTARLSKLAEEHGVAYVDAPVLGSRQPAEEGTLTVLASGPESARPKVEPIFDAVGSKTIWLGERDEAARMKLVFNAFVLLLLPALGQVVVLARKLGIEPERFFDVLKGTGVDSFYVQSRGRAMAAGEFAPNFALELARKDLALALEAAGGDLPIAQAALAAYDRALAAGHAHDDMAAVVTAL
jgi:3-hydroxyisobutyrate dehydrogenase